MDINQIFAKNFEILENRFPTLAEKIKEAAPFDVQTTSSKDGGICYVRKNEAGQWHGLSNPQDPIQQAQQAVKNCEDRLGKGIAPAVVVGLNPGYVLEILSKHFKENYYDNYIPRRIYVVIDSAECLFGWLCQSDRSEILQKEEIEFYWKDEVRRIVRLCKKDEQRSHLFIPVSSLPEHVTIKLIDSLAKFFLERQEEEKRLFEESCRYYEKISDDELDVIFKGEAGRKPRLMIPSHASSTVVQYSVRDTAAMFEKEGWDVKIIYMKTDLSRWRVNKEINEFKPDIYLQVNHLRTENIDFYPPHLMFITWIQDTVSYINNSESAKTWNEHVQSKKERRDLIIGYVGQIKEYGYQEDRLEECPMIVNQEIFKERELTPEEKAKYECDICFASNRSKETSLIVKEDLAPKLEKYGFTEDILMSIHDHLWEYYRDEQTCTSYTELEDKIIELPEVCRLIEKLINKDEHDFIIQRIYWELNDVIYRHIVLEWIDEMGNKKLHLYGRGWEDHPRFAKYSKGILNHGEELALAYQSAKHCLHLNSREGEHQRLNEILNSDSLLLTRTKERESLYPSEIIRITRNYLSAVNTINKKDILTFKAWLESFLHIYLNVENEDLHNSQSFIKRFLARPITLEHFFAKAIIFDSKEHFLKHGTVDNTLNANEFLKSLLKAYLSTNKKASFNEGGELGKAIAEIHLNLVALHNNKLSLIKSPESLSPKNQLLLTLRYLEAKNIDEANFIWDTISLSKSIQNFEQLQKFLVVHFNQFQQGIDHNKFILLIEKALNFKFNHILNIKLLDFLLNKNCFEKVKSHFDLIESFETTIEDDTAIYSFISRNSAALTTISSLNKIEKNLFKSLQSQKQKFNYMPLVWAHIYKADFYNAVKLIQYNSVNFPDSIINRIHFILLLIELGDTDSAKYEFDLIDCQYKATSNKDKPILAGYAYAALKREHEAFNLLDQHKTDKNYITHYINTCFYCVKPPISLDGLEKLIDNNNPRLRPTWKLKLANYYFREAKLDKHKNIILSLSANEFACYLTKLEYVKHLCHTGNIEKANKVIDEEYLSDDEYKNGYSTIAWYSNLRCSECIKFYEKDYSQNRQTYIWKIRYAVKLLENKQKVKAIHIFKSLQKSSFLIKKWEEEFKTLEQLIRPNE